MKLISMHVDNFGGLQNYDYTFDEGLNVVLHDNGWGKTTMATFLKAMLYGYDTRRSKDITENERKRYLPWQGGEYGGFLDFESEGVQYRIYRTFGETPRFDSAKVIRLDTKTTARIPADKIGETLFHLDANAFQRSVFINQNGLSIDGAASSIHTRLNALVSQANDVAAFDGAIAKLTQQIKVYEKTGARGQLGDITRQIADRERLRDQLEKDIYAQDAARERIIQIDSLLSVIDKDLAEKSKQLDALSGEGKKREAAQKMLDDLRKQIDSIQQEMTAIEAELGGQVPTGNEIDQIKRYEQTLISLRKRIGELEAEHEKYAQEYKAIVKAYDGILPTAAQLDEIQAVYGEIIIYMCAITAIDRTLYEGAVLDGATFWQQVRYITLPLLRPTIATIFILSIGSLLSSDFGLFYQVPMDSGALQEVTQTLDVYVYKALMQQANFSYSSAAAFLQSAVGCALLFLSNALIRRVDRDSALM